MSELRKLQDKDHGATLDVLSRKKAIRRVAVLHRRRNGELPSHDASTAAAAIELDSR